METTAFQDLNKMKRRPLHEQVYLELREKLMVGAFRPGQRLPVRTVAEALSTSVAPVREALARLLSEGAVASLPNSAIAVPIMTKRRYRCVMQIRELLEGLAGELATPQLSREEISDLRELCEATAKAFDKGSANISTYLFLNQKFHFSIYAGARESHELNRLIGSLWLQTGPFLRGVPLHEVDVHDFHWDAIEALEARDPAAVRRAIERDISENARHLIAYAEDDDDGGVDA